MAAAHAATVQAIVAALQRADLPLPVVQLWGDDLDGQRDVAARAAAQCGLQLFELIGDHVPANPHEIDALAAWWERGAVLSDAALLVECAESACCGARFAEQVGGATFLGVREPVALVRGELRRQVQGPDRPTSCAFGSRLWAMPLHP